MHTTPTNQPSLQEQVANLSGHLISLLMKYEGHDRASARKIAIKMSELGSDYRDDSPAPASTNAVHVADAFMSIFGFKRVDEVLSIRKGSSGKPTT
jgi:hypothetical protein